MLHKPDDEFILQRSKDFFCCNGRVTSKRNGSCWKCTWH